MTDLYSVVIGIKGTIKHKPYGKRKANALTTPIVNPFPFVVLCFKLGHLPTLSSLPVSGSKWNGVVHRKNTNHCDAGSVHTCTISNMYV